MVTHTRWCVSVKQHTSCWLQLPVPLCLRHAAVHTSSSRREAARPSLTHITTSAKCPQPLEKNHFFPKLTLRDICTPNLCGSRARTRLLMSSSPLVSKPRWRTCSEHTCSYLFHTLKTKIRNCFSALFAVRVCMLEASATFRTSGM